MADQNEGAPLRVPQDAEAEQAVLGSILLATDPQDLLADIMTILEPNDFYRTAHRLIYSAILALDETQRARSEEHTSELQSRFDLVCRLLLEKKKKSKQYVAWLSD